MTSLDAWMLEVRRLSAVVERPRPMPADVTLSHLAILAQGKGHKMIWRASCAAATVEAESAQAAMRDLLTALHKEIDKRIKAQKDELAKLQEARRNGLKVVDSHDGDA